jgi:hypothetical protein
MSDIVLVTLSLYINYSGSYVVVGCFIIGLFNPWSYIVVRDDVAALGL